MLRNNTLQQNRLRLIRGLFIGALCSVLLAGCGKPVNHSRAAYILIDISRNYAAELEKAEALNNYLLSNLTSGDTLMIAFTDNGSFSERNLIAHVSFDHRPSVANQQKRAVQATLNKFIEEFNVPSHHNDITGGVLLATDYLKNIKASRKYLFILSDLHEDLPPWLNRDVTIDLDGVKVIALNVKRQRSDNNDPQDYHERLANWRQRVEQSGGQWQVVADMTHLDTAVALR